MAVQDAALPDVQSHGRDVFFALGLIFILTVLFVPIPAMLIDFGLALSVSLSILILMVSLWIARPLDFSSFPTVLLIVTMLRLSLNIATTRAILSEGNEGVNAAGYVIGGFSHFVMSGDFVIGLIVFLILIVVNFVVITKGATRIAEVGARFTLDAIPGKQMSIDADLSAGIIDEREAQSRRRELEEESSFFGSMDGASKFVRGDAIAGLLITAINILGGIIIGVTRHGMELSEAVDVFTKLSVGDGLVSQIPALIVSLAAGLLVSKGGTRGSADKAVLGQLGAHPKALYVAAALLFVLATMPGLPFAPFVFLAGLMATAAYVIPMNLRAQEERDEQAKQDAQRKSEETAKDSVKASLHTPEIEVVLGSQLSSKLLPHHQELAFRMSKMRKKFASQYGFVVPEVHLGDDFSIDAKSYRIKIHGTLVAGHEMRLGEIMVFDR
ncbi:MAG: FHIPEP family type III secretion protein, partial [Brucellaceae bacterium]|nr:FHIPEP family type III secretion protein [Brucellaceae bacterium]